jgi:serine/threonine-protein kinase
MEQVVMSESNNNSSGLLREGDKVGSYEIREQLNIGGQCVVYKAHDPALDRWVAVKQLSPNLAASEEYRDQFRQTLRTLVRLGAHNPAIVDVLGIVEDERGFFYIEEFVEGHTLEATIRDTDGPTESRATLLILFRLAAALHEIHQTGLIHRDLKPSNILIQAGLHPKIIDFGVAAMEGSEVSLPLATTKYLAPELYSSREVDGRADIYSLGFLAYELLLGRPKFNEVFEDVVRDKHSEALRWMKWHGNESVEAPPLHEVDPDVPLSLSHIVARMIEKDPDNRFQNTEELGRAIKGAFGAKRGVAGPLPSSMAGLRVASPDEGGSEVYKRDLVSDGEFDTAELDTPQSKALSSGQSQSAVLEEGPPTAPLPTQPMRRGTRVAMILVAALLFLGGAATLGIWLHQKAQSTRERISGMKELYQNAVTAYKNEEYPLALDEFQKVADHYPDSTLGQKAVVAIPLCRTRLAIQNRNWEEAQLAERDATRLAKELQASVPPDNQELTSWTRDRLDEIEELRELRQNEETYYKTIQQAESALASVITDEDFDRIKDTLVANLARKNVVLTPEQDETVKNLKNRIDREKIRFQFGALIEQGNEALHRQDFDTAKARYIRAREILDEPLAVYLAPEQKQILADQAGMRLEELELLRKKSTLLDELETARANEAPQQQVNILKALLKLPPEELPAAQRANLQKEYNQVRVALLLEEGHALLANQNLDQAREIFQAVLTIDPDNAVATEKLSYIEKRPQREKLIQAGNEAYAAEQYSKAMEQYLQAAEYGVDDSLQQSIDQTRYKLILQEAGQAVASQEWAKAEKLYRDALDLKPESLLEVQRLEEKLQTQKAFYGMLLDGNQLLAKGRYDDAIEKFKQAQTSLPASELELRQKADTAINLSTYKKHIQAGDAAVKRGDLAAARWNYKIAQRAMDTKEVQNKLDNIP